MCGAENLSRYRDNNDIYARKNSNSRERNVWLCLYTNDALSFRAYTLYSFRAYIIITININRAFIILLLFIQGICGCLFEYMCAVFDVVICSMTNRNVWKRSGAKKDYKAFKNVHWKCIPQIMFMFVVRQNMHLRF